MAISQPAAIRVMALLDVIAIVVMWFLTFMKSEPFAGPRKGMHWFDYAMDTELFVLGLSPLRALALAGGTFGRAPPYKSVALLLLLLLASGATLLLPLLGTVGGVRFARPDCTQYILPCYSQHHNAGDR